MRVKNLGMSPGLANVRPPGSTKFANAPPPGLTSSPEVAEGGGGGWAQLELTYALGLVDVLEFMIG